MLIKRKFIEDNKHGADGYIIDICEFETCEECGARNVTVRDTAGSVDGVYWPRCENCLPLANNEINWEYLNIIFCVLSPVFILIAWLMS